MIKEVLPLWYGECETDGSWAGLVPNQHVLTNERQIDLTPEGNPLYLRKRGKMLAGQGGNDGQTHNWKWDGNQWVQLGWSYGVNTVAFDPAGNVVENIPAYGSQGIRWIDEAGVHTSDQTYGPGEFNLSQFTTHGDITVGQSYDDGAIAVVNGKRYLLHPGYTVFIRFNRDGDNLAISIVTPAGLVLMWLTKDELLALPVDAPQAPQPEKKPEQPKPEPKPEPTPVSHPSQLATIESIRAKYPTPLGPTHPAFLIEVASTLGVLLFKKDSGTHVTLPNGTNVSQDIVVYPDDHEGFDILNDGEGAANPSWSSKGTMTGEFVSVAGSMPGGPSPIPPVATPGEQLDASLKALGAQIELLKGALAAQGAMIDTLRAKLDHVGASNQINGVKVALRTDNGRYICAEGGGDGEVNATRTQVGAWETFRIETQ